MVIMALLIACGVATGERGTIHVYLYIQINPAGHKHTSQQLEVHTMRLLKAVLQCMELKAKIWLDPLL